MYMWKVPSSYSLGWCSGQSWVVSGAELTWGWPTAPCTVAPLYETSPYKVAEPTRGRLCLWLGLHDDANHIGCVLPQGGYKPVIGVRQQLNNIVIQWIHVLHQPLITTVVHLMEGGKREGLVGWSGGEGSEECWRKREEEMGVRETKW